MAVVPLPGKVSVDARVWMGVTRLSGPGVWCRKTLRGGLLIDRAEEDPGGYWFVVYWRRLRYCQGRALPVVGYAGSRRCIRLAIDEVGIG